jgi:deoxycytidylate deaminase
VYGHGFLLVGVYATEQERLEYLIEKNAPKDEAIALIKRDAEEPGDYGQHTRETFQLCDVFIQYRDGAYREELERFCDLLFSNPYITPTQDEHGMFLAYASSLRSGQLSRQVGAAILTRKGDVLATGCNDVPKAGGGFYWPGKGDLRDGALGYDSNDLQRDKMSSQLGAILAESEEALIQSELSKFRESGRKFVPEDRLEEFVEEFRNLLTSAAGTRVNNVKPKFRAAIDITEFGRAVHAEMDALLMCARSGVSPRGATLYVTTFPCHNCTRHIIAAGIERVYYIEPYAKSRAEELHEDAIVVEDRVRKRTRQLGWRIPFKPFVGIGPRRYFDLFSLTLSSGLELRRKIGGKTFQIDRDNGVVRCGMPPNSYMQREAIAVEKLEVIPSQQLELDIQIDEN